MALDLGLFKAIDFLKWKKKTEHFERENQSLLLVMKTWFKGIRLGVLVAFTLETSEELSKCLFKGDLLCKRGLNTVVWPLMVKKYIY